MLNGTTYMVRPFMQPRNSLSSVARISAGSSQLLVGPASISRSEQMNVRSSTRATSLGSDRARKEPGRFDRVELHERARVDELDAEAGALLDRAVEPVDAVGLAELDHLVDPAQQAPVRGGSVHERHWSRPPQVRIRGGASVPGCPRVPGNPAFDSM